MKSLLSIILSVGFLTLSAGTVQDDLKPYLSPAAWSDRAGQEITPDLLAASIKAARTYMVAQQKEDGNFTYALDLSTGQTIDDDNQVRQAGAMWAVACLHREDPTPETLQAFQKCLAFMKKHTRTLDSGETLFVYPGETSVKTGTIALLCLALCDFLETPQLPSDLRKECTDLLTSYTFYLRSMEMQNGSWSKTFKVAIAYPSPEGSPYYDGEALLAYCKIAKTLHRDDLIKRINEALPKLIQTYTIDVWKANDSHDPTKGFYQWGSMACEEYILAGWVPHAQLAADAAKALAFWQVYENQLENRRGNTGYALEGLAATINIAQMTGDKETEALLIPVAKRVMSKLILCQYGGPLSDKNPRFAAIKTPPQGAVGGITESQTGTMVRIDTVQHQIHAMIKLHKLLTQTTK